MDNGQLIYPAHAGINRLEPDIVRVGMYLPRTRRDKPKAFRLNCKTKANLPRTRGDKPALQ